MDEGRSRSRNPPCHDTPPIGDASPALISHQPTPVAMGRNPSRGHGPCLGPQNLHPCRKNLVCPAEICQTQNQPEGDWYVGLGMGFKPCPWAWEARLQSGGAPIPGTLFRRGTPDFYNPGLNRSAGAFLVFRGWFRIHCISARALLF